MPAYLDLIADGTPGNRCDVTPIFADAQAFAALVDDLVALAADHPHDVVAGLDALGFVLGAAIATRTGKGFLTIRKGGKLPVAVDRREFVDYTGERKSLELRLDAFAPGTRVLLVDEWVETGAQISTAAALIEAQGGVVAAVACINCDAQAIRARYPVLAVMERD
mgnify:CR=1 FL=1